MNRSSDNETPPDDEALFTLAASLGERLRGRGRVLAAAESCTGGWIAKALTDVPGSSDWFAAGFVTYSNAEKTRALGVPAALIEREGAVGEAVVRAMAEGARRVSGADLAVAVSGIAGPGGGLPGKPVGTVWFAWTAEAGTRAGQRHFEGGREAVRRLSVAYAIGGLDALLEGA